MDIRILLDKLAKLNLPKDQFVVISSGSMAIRGIREANDLDILVTRNLWKELSKKFKVNKDTNGIEKLELDNDIEIAGEGSTFKDSSIASDKEIFDTADIINGVKFINLNLLKKFKLKMGREKDVRDIKLIDEYQSKKV